MLFETLGAVSDLGRLSEIASVLVRYGFRDFVERSGIRALLERAGAKIHWQPFASDSATTTPARVRRALEELGPTFVKFGQLLASRHDLLPHEWTAELGSLHASVTPVPFERLRDQLEADLGGKPNAIFARFEETPLAAGSIAQVHAATAHDGSDLVVKIRRPGVDKTIFADLRLMARLARVLEDEGGEIRRFRPVRVVREFARTMRAELDFATEARNLRTLQRNLESMDGVVLPEVIDPLVRERLLVMTRLRGLSAAEWLESQSIGRHRDQPFDSRAVAHVGADVVLQMVFGDGFYHADPHPGNLMFLEDGRLGLLDFGQVGRLSESRRRQLVQLLAGVLARDEERAVDVLLEWAPGASTDVDALAADVRAFIDRYHGVELDNLDVARLLMDVSEIVRENELFLPADISVLIKVFVTLEGLGRALDPEFRLSTHIEPAARRLERDLLSKRGLMRRGVRDLRSLMIQLPTDLRRLLTRVRRGEVHLELDMKRLDRFGNQISSSANRLTIGMITAALIVGTAIAMTIDSGPKIFGMPALGLLGFLCSVTIGVGLLWSIARSSHRKF
ncbi:MAG: phosphotransferase [Planctomycetes bacterium]|nr:phosphotransferase [Planctomycetota bacterium]